MLQKFLSDTVLDDVTSNVLASVTLPEPVGNLFEKVCPGDFQIMPKRWRAKFHPDVMRTQGSNGTVGRVGPMGHVGRVSHLGPVAHVSSVGHVGPVDHVVSVGLWALGTGPGICP